MQPEMPTASVEFWNNRFHSADDYARVAVRPPNKAETAALHWFGDIRGKRILDLGTGNGAAALVFASLGADVIALDSSSTAIENLTQFCRANRISNVRPMVADAADLAGLPTVDFLYGSMILHHLEPFPAVARSLARALAPGGRAFFFETHCAVPLLAWCRTHLAGRAWIPQYGDRDEFPLTSQEVDILRRHFTVRQEFPEMRLIRLVSAYLLRERLASLSESLDGLLARTPLRRYSYLQFLYIERPA